MSGAAIELGGPNPFPAEETADCPATAHGYLCTRDSGHDLPHVAMGDVVVAVWPPYEELPL